MSDAPGCRHAAKARVGVTDLFDALAVVIVLLEAPAHFNCVKIGEREIHVEAAGKECVAGAEEAQVFEGEGHGSTIGGERDVSTRARRNSPFLAAEAVVQAEDGPVAKGRCKTVWARLNGRFR